MNFEKLKPINDLVLVKYESPKFETESGIIFQISATKMEKRPTEGEVLAIGGKVEEVKVGDKVKFENIRGYDLDDGLMLLGEKTIQGVVIE